MLYIGWDIGIKNLAYCIIELLDNKQKIIEMEIINLIEEEIPIITYCSKTNKNGKKCPSKAIYKHKNNNNSYCNKHFKLAIAIEPVNGGKKIKEKDLKKIKIKKTNANLVPLELIGRTLFKKLDENTLFTQCNNIIIENQPVLKNPKMKSIQIMLYSYFLIKNINMDNIQLINASNKLKVFKGELDEPINQMLKKINDKYRRNKITAIEHCKKMLENNKELDFLKIFEGHKKKDDLADAYLMCQYFIKKHSKINKK